ncbi:MAG: hypothetical protein M1828_002826 [Chrysothrix sp. TS-e1954]|nr:MAG: hypothetical protein M1828_002826 [Chrysothrix sp. TS-e1954]
MTAHVLSTELGVIIHESKRKEPELKSSAEKSLQELKSLTVTSEAQYAAGTRARTVETFVLACQSRIPRVKLAGVTCLQRLIVANGLPTELLRQALDVYQDCLHNSTDVQLRILQALPSLLQNYGSSLQSELHALVLQTCIALQQAKTPAVSSTASATLQQAISFLFDKVGNEDDEGRDPVTRTEIRLGEKTASVAPAAHDAYEVFTDLARLVDAQSPRFIRHATLSPAFGLELIESILANYSKIFHAHDELAYLLEIRLMPLISRLLAANPSFPVSVRLARVLCILLRDHCSTIQGRCKPILETLNQGLVSDGPSAWRRGLYMELFRFIYSTEDLAVKLYTSSHNEIDRTNVMQVNLDIFVRVATEKPNLIGVGQQSSYPSHQTISKSMQQEQAVLEAGQAAGSIGNDFSISSTNVPGISTQSSLTKLPLLEQVDKLDPLPVPDTYVYALVLISISNLSEALAKVVLPVTMQHQHKNIRRRKTMGEESDHLQSADAKSPTEEDRSKSPLHSRRHQNKMIPPNPLELEEHEAFQEIKAVATLIDACWPAVLATASTFLYASLDAEFYRGLVRAFQKFVQVAGLLRLSTPRDAFLTTLTKAAVPPSLLKGNVPTTPGAVTMSPKPGAMQSPRPESYFSKDSTNSPLPSRRGSLDIPTQSLTQRNLMCLRALVNLAIALGPILAQAWSIVLECVQKAHVLLAASSPAAIARDYKSNILDDEGDTNEAVPQSTLMSEISAVEGAVGRLFQSTSDYPVEALDALLMSLRALNEPERPADAQADTLGTATPRASRGQRRVPSVSGVATSATMQPAYVQFVVARLGEIAHANVKRMITATDNQTWENTVGYAAEYAADLSGEPHSRLMAAQVVASVAVESAVLVSSYASETRRKVQGRSLRTLRDEIHTVQKASSGAGNTNATAIEVQRSALDGLRSILERVGDSLDGDWEVCFGIIDSVFSTQSSRPSSEDRVNGSLNSHIPVPTVTSSTQMAGSLLRLAFGSLHLICSDFLGSMHYHLFATLPEYLLKFAAQTDDLNISLTTVTLFSNVADFLRSQIPHFDIIMDQQSTPVRTLRDHVKAQAIQGSMQAIWLNVHNTLVLLASDRRQEVRNGALHTILRIVESNGSDFTSSVWDIIFRTVILDLMTRSIQSYRALQEKTGSPAGMLELVLASSRIVLSGASRLFTNYYDQLTQLADFPSLWQTFTESLAEHIGLDESGLTAASFMCLSAILENVEDPANFDKKALNATASLWAIQAEDLLANDIDADDSREDALLAYVGAGRQIYRLSEANINSQQVGIIIANLEKCINMSCAKPYTSDRDSLTPLQSAVLELISTLRSDLTDVPARLIVALTKFIQLPLEQCQTEVSGRKLTFVAFAKRSMQILQNVIITHLECDEMYSDGRLLEAFNALALLIEHKYKLATQGKEPSLWRSATQSALTSIDGILPVSLGNRLQQDLTQMPRINSCWPAIERISNAIRRAEYDELPDNGRLRSDESFDLQSISTLRQRMGLFYSLREPFDKIGKQYCFNLFHASLIHRPTADDVLPVLGSNPLSNYATIRLGRVYEPIFNPRIRMCYYCFDELFDVVSMTEATEAAEDLRKEAFKLLLARCALPIKTYIADQPLRGLMPMMTSQRLELLYILKRLRELRCDLRGEQIIGHSSDQTAAMPAIKVHSTEQEHLAWLMPLLVQALGRKSHDPDLSEAFRALLNEPFR